MEHSVPNPDPFDALPDGVLSLVLERLGLQSAAAARAVCKRWRQAAEAVTWKRLEVVTWRPERADHLAALLSMSSSSEDDDAGAGTARRWIRVAHSARLHAEITGSHVSRGAANQRSPWDAALALAFACTAASGGLGDVDLKCARSMAAHSCVGDVLEALAVGQAKRARPPAPGGALRGLALRDACGACCRGLPPAAELDDCLRPFSGLESLVLPVCCAVDAEGASALARCLPRLRKLGINLQTYKDAARLSALAALECLDVWSDEGDAAPLLEGLASGPAAQSLKELEFSAVLSAAALRALPRLAALERLPGTFSLEESVRTADLACLGACPALLSVGPLRLSCLSGGAGASAEAVLADRLGGLAAALRRSPRLKLFVHLDFELSAPTLEALEGLARAGSGGRLELEMRLDMAGPVAEAAAALAAAPPRKLSLIVRGAGEHAAAGRLSSLSAFAGCSLGETEVLLRLSGAPHAAALAAVVRALPSARVL
eukprot:tig00000145_g8844.t1